jgi:hypothetical protein
MKDYPFKIVDREPVKPGGVGKMRERLAREFTSEWRTVGAASYQIHKHTLGSYYALIARVNKRGKEVLSFTIARIEP